MKRLIPLFKVYMSPNAKAAINKVLDSGFIGEGPVVKELEKRWKNSRCSNALLPLQILLNIMF